MIMARKKKLDTLGKVMSKVAQGKKLTPRERKILAGALDGAKKAKTERSRKRTYRTVRKKHSITLTRRRR